MQHTDKYKFNLIETSDVFNPDALNANAQAVEAELAALAATDAALAANLGTGGHNARISTGTFTGAGSGATRTLTFDFKPLLVIVQANYSSAMLVRGAQNACSTKIPSRSPDYYTANNIVWGDNSVTFSGDLSNFANTTYYVAIGVSLNA